MTRSIFFRPAHALGLLIFAIAACSDDNPTGPSLGSPLIQSVATGGHACALTTAGAAYCWGYNGSGQLGNNDTGLVVSTPVAVVGGFTFRMIAVSKASQTSCGVITDGTAYCWGANGDGQLGDGTTIRRLAPTRVATAVKFKSIALGNTHTCGLATNGTAYCWGFSANGAFGDGSTGNHLTPVVAAPGMTFESIGAGGDYTCGLTAAGAAYCWGIGLSGQLGTGNTTNSATPVAVSGDLTFASLALGGLTACGLTADGKAYCWGYDFYGSVGDGSSATEDGVTRRLAPVAVKGGLTFRTLAAGNETMCAVTSTGAGYCWGNNNAGGVGDGTLTHRSTPVAVAGGLTFDSIAPGTGISCGVTRENAVYCWGENSNGDLGDGTTADRPTPGPVRWATSR